MDNGFALFARRRNKGNATIETVCHDPALPFYGQYLTDYNNTICQMKQVKGMEDDFYICSCNLEECNDQLYFTDGDAKKDLLPVLLVSLVPALITAIVLLSTVYCYHCSASRISKRPKATALTSRPAQLS
ncbi:hypothetical protein QQF64_012995 [Cirrhinus molitorella]|uniref:Transforming growth factor beta receptor 2 ectodomain domain-containing protein n=1 Tax=Cirrhinus molitorella TaxID=172907 RepID=A0ABR3LT51_9TELE